MEHEFRGYALVLHDGADPRTGGVAIAGFTTAGMVGVIAASHIIKSLKLISQDHPLEKKEKMMHELCRWS